MPARARPGPGPHAGGNATGDFSQLTPRAPGPIVSRAQACDAGFARKTPWSTGRYEDGAKLFESLTTRDEYVEFLTLPGYERLARDLSKPVAAGAPGTRRSADRCRRRPRRPH